MAIFTYTPDFGAKVAIKPSVRVSSFGDGYEQRQANGINSRSDTWDLQFQRRTNTEADAIMEFLDARAGIQAFDWTPPNEATAIRVICREWNKTLERYNFNSVGAQFIRVYEP
jgi:phage-related protein